MPDRRRALAAAFALALMTVPLSAQQLDQGPQVDDAAARALLDVRPLLEEGQRAIEKKDWDAAVAAYEKAFRALGGSDALGGWRDQALYNAACAHARAGRAAEAADAFARSVKNGLRPLVGRGPTGAWVEAPGLTLEHVLVDADLDPIRGRPEYVAALRPYLAAGEPVVELAGDAKGEGSAPAVIVLAADDEEAERALPAWRVAARGRRIVLAALAGPVRAKPSQRRWLLRDGDDRWAVAKIKETLDLLSKDERVDLSRVFLVGVGERPGEAAWAAAMAEHKRLAGFAAPGARFHPEWHADAVAALPATTRVALFASDAKAAGLLKGRGIEAAAVEPSKDESALAAAVLDAMLRE
jgi:hypothetical protein